MLHDQLTFTNRRHMAHCALSGHPIDSPGYHMAHILSEEFLQKYLVQNPKTAALLMTFGTLGVSSNIQMRYICRCIDTKKLADPELCKFTFIFEIDQICRKVNARSADHAQVKAVLRSEPHTH